MKKKLHVTTIGLGYVGCVTAACIAESGHKVIGFDVDGEKVRLISSRKPTVFEPGLEELIERNVSNGRLSATTSLAKALENTDICMITVGTPVAANGDLNLEYIFQVAENLHKHISRIDQEVVFVLRSTVKPGTTAEFYQKIIGTENCQKKHLISVAYNPEFLREGTAISDYISPPSIVIGTSDGKNHDYLHTLYSKIKSKVFVTDFKTAELTKYINNSWHATKVAFANEIGAIAKSEEANVEQLNQIFLADTKLNISSHYLRPGAPYGGSCLPKDLSGLFHLGLEHNLAVPLLQAVARSNEAHKLRQLEQIKKATTTRNIAMLGLTFKENTDDLRSSPFLDLAKKLKKDGYEIHIFDENLNSALASKTNSEMIIQLLGNLTGSLERSMINAVQGADVICVSHPMDGLVNNPLFVGKTVINLGMKNSNLGFMDSKMITSVESSD